MCFYVDDLIYINSSFILNDSFKVDIMQEFEMKDLMLMHYFLNMEVFQNNGIIFIYQTKYATNMLKNYGVERCKSFPTLVVHGALLCKDDTTKKVNVKEFRSIVVSLIFLTNINDFKVYVWYISFTFEGCKENYKVCEGYSWLWNTLFSF